MDVVDQKILKILQEDASGTAAEIGRAVGLSATPCWKRIQKLEACGVIRKRVALVERHRVGLGVSVQVVIQTGDHTPEAIDTFIEAVRGMPEVLEFHRLAGDVDFLLRIVAVDVGHYDAIYRRLAALMPMRRISSYFELEQLKSETALPLGLAESADAKASAAFRHAQA